MKSISIFADYGLDDAAATVSILNRGERFQKINIIPIGGNVPTEVSYRNCYTLLSNFPESWNKITVVSTLNLTQPYKNLTDIHGNDGMGDIFDIPTEKPKINEISFREWLQNYSEDEIILSLGPMTLVQTVLEKHSCKQLVIMGGIVNSAPNYNGYEFNQALDVKAFEYCLKFPHTAITLDTCRIDKLDMRKVEITDNDLHSKILKADIALSITRGEEGCYVWDDVAAIYLLYPDRFEVRKEKDPFGNIISNAHYISEKFYCED